MTRGRKPTPDAASTAVPMNALAIRESLDAADGLAQVVNAVSAAQVAFSQRVGALIGRQQSSDAFQKLVTVTTLMDLAHIKESKEYKDLQAIGPDGKPVTVTTWDLFCSVVVGRSREQVDADLLNLKTFGAEFLESAQRMGVGYRELRDMRAIPADQRTELLEAAKAGDKETLIDVAEGLIEQHTREKKDLLTQLVQSEQRLSAKDKLIAKKDEKLNRLLEAEELRTSGTLEQREQGQMDDLRGVALACDEAVARALRAIDAVMAGPASDACDLAARQTLDYITQRFVLAAQSLGMALMVDGEEVVPAWHAADLALVDQALAMQAEKATAKQLARSTDNGHAG